MIFLIIFVCSSFYAAVYGVDELCTICLCGIAEYNKQQMYITNCTSAGITKDNIALLGKLPNETQVLIFTGNNVPVLPMNIFGEEKNLTYLKVIDMTDNKIEEIKGKTFHHAPLVERVILNHNSISLASSHFRVNVDLNEINKKIFRVFVEIKKHRTEGNVLLFLQLFSISLNVFSDNISNLVELQIFSNFEYLRELHLTDAFLDYKSADLPEQLHAIFVDSNLQHLEKLHLEENEIENFVNQRVFCNLKNLLDLHLGNNKLKNLDFDIKCLTRLRYLDLEGNEIERFTNDQLAVFDFFPAQNRSLFIDIHENPFICDCVTNNLYFWLQKTKVTVKNNMTIQCHYLNNDSRLIYLKDLDVSACMNLNLYVNDSDKEVHFFAHICMISISFFLFVFLIILSARYILDYCRHSVAPAGKVHYVVIKNRDDGREVHV